MKWAALPLLNLLFCGAWAGIWYLDYITPPVIPFEVVQDAQPVLVP